MNTKKYSINPWVVGAGILSMAAGIVCQPLFVIGIGICTGEVVSCTKDNAKLRAKSKAYEEGQA